MRKAACMSASLHGMAAGSRTSPIREAEWASMLLFLLCAAIGFTGVSRPVTALFTQPSALLLNPWVMGDASGMGPAVVSQVCGAFAAAVSMRAGAARTSDWRG